MRGEGGGGRDVGGGGTLIELPELYAVANWTVMLLENAPKRLDTEQV